MKVLIYKPTKNAMQSGKAGSDKWLIKFIEAKRSRSNDNVMGWTSSNNTQNQLRLKFATKEDAIKYAGEQGYEVIVEEPEVSSLKKKSYADNFK